MRHWTESNQEVIQMANNAPKRKKEPVLQKYAIFNPMNGNLYQHNSYNSQAMHKRKGTQNIN